MLAQQVVLENDTDPSDPAVINDTVDLKIGSTGTGALTIEDGGTLTNATAIVGDGGGSRGSATVSGDGSTWTNAGDLIIGQSGIGTLLVEDGGTVSSTNGSVGAASGSIADPNSVTVTGSASEWYNSGQLHVGDAGAATVDILDGGLLTSMGYSFIGAQAGSNGTVTVSGFGSTWIGGGPLLIGNEGTGTLRVEGGGKVSSVNGALGGNTGSGATGNGTVIVSGTDGSGNASTWDTGNIYVGFVGTGTLNIADGGAVTSDSGGGAAATGYIGYQAGATGTVTVSSSTSDVSTWTLTNDIQVGVEGTGTLNIQKGGRVRVRSGVTIARDNGSNGTLNLTGDASGRGILETGAVIKGNGGTSVLNLDGGILRATRNEADFLNGFDTLNIGSEGAWFDTNAHAIAVGTEFTGSSSFNKLGLGTLTLTGDSSAFLGTTTITAGILQLGNGGTTGSIVGDVANDGVLAFNRSDDIEFDGTISGGGAVEQTGSGTVILTADNSYTGGTTIRAGTLQVGKGGTTGSIVGDVSNDGVLAFNRSDDLLFSGLISGSGAIEQDGGGKTTLTADNSFTGTTTISGGTLQLGNGGTTGSIAGDVVNNGTIAFDRSDNVVFDGLISGSGALVKNGAGVLELTADNSYLGTTDVNAGMLLVNSDQSAATGQTTIGSGATLGGSGTLGGDVTIADGAILAPGNSPGTLTINGDLSLADGATLDYQFGEAGVAGGALNDLVNVGGNLILDGTLNVSVSSGGSFGSGIYRVFNYDGTLTDNGLELGTMPSGSDVFVQTAIDHQVNLVNSAGLDLTFWDGDAGPKNDGTIGGGDGTWSLLGSGDNWTETTGTINAPYRNESFAVFSGTSGTVTVDNGDGAVKVTGMQFASDGYVITGDALTLAGSQVTVRVGDGTAAGAGHTATIDAALTGSSALVKTDLGTLVLTGTNTYTGGTSINGGTVRIASDANLGDAAGDLSLDGGTLHTTADITSGRSVKLTGEGRFLTKTGTTTTLAGDINGKGSLIKDGSGTLVVAGDATQSGGTTIRAGTLQVGKGGTTGSIVGDVSNDGVLAFNRSDDLLFSGLISGSGAIEQDGGGKTTLTADNSFTGTTTISGGTLQLGNGGTTGSIAGDVVNNGTIAFDRSDLLTFRGRIDGAGGLVQRGTGTTILTGTSTYTGATEVLAGTLTVDGSIAGSAVRVHEGATLSGSGTVGATTIASGGMIKPGDGLGTITVDGDYVQRDGATYQVGVDPNSQASDRIAVNGKAVLDAGATVDIVKTTNTPYVVGTRYTILTTTGGLRGTFDLTGEADLTAFIGVVDDYDDHNAYLVTRQTRTVRSVGRTPNQIATGEGIDSLVLPDPVKTAVLNLPDEDTVTHALDQLSGEIHASVKTAAMEDSHLVRDAATDRIREAFCGVAAGRRSDGQGMEENSRRSPSDCGAVPDQLTTWGQGFGSWSHTDSDGNAAELGHSAGGFIGGADAPVFDTWRLGVLAGYGSGSMTVNDRSSSAKTDEYYLGVYGGTQWGGLGLRAGATYTWQDIDTKRSPNFPGFSENLSAGYHAGLTQIFGDLGYQFDVGPVALEPFANLAFASLDSGGFSERGGTAFLTSPGGTTETWFTTFGLRASTAVALGGVDALARGSFGWRHAFADTTPMSTHAFDGSAPFQIAGVPIARDAAVINAGLDFAVRENATLAISYGGQFSRGAIDQSMHGRFSLRF